MKMNQTAYSPGAFNKTKAELPLSKRIKSIAVALKMIIL